MGQVLLYSTNVFLKQHIQARYFNDVHYVWCSEHFDSQAVSKYEVGYQVPPSSNPADIYRDLKNDVARSDSHSPKISAQMASLKSLAVRWEKNNDISSEDLEDIIYLVENASFDQWRPLVYVIPRASVETRLQAVPAEKCAGLGNEFIIPDLHRAEFDFIEF